MFSWLAESKTVKKYFYKVKIVKKSFKQYIQLFFKRINNFYLRLAVTKFSLKVEAAIIPIFWN